MHEHWRGHKRTNTLAAASHVSGQKGIYLTDNRSTVQKKEDTGALSDTGTGDSAHGETVQLMMRGGRGSGGRGEGGRGGRGGGRGVPVPDRYNSAKWEESKEVKPESSPYVSAIREGAQQAHPARLSLAYAVDDTTENADEFGRAVSLTGGNENLSTVSSCHPVAARVVTDLGTGPVSSHGCFEGSAATPMAEHPSGGVAHEEFARIVEAVQKGEMPAQVVRYTHGSHSIAVFVSPHGVEPLESWAGGAETEEEAEERRTAVSAPLHRSVIKPKDPIPLEEALPLVKDLGHRHKKQRRKSLDRLSFAGIEGFESTGEQLKNIPRSLDRRNARPPDEVKEQVRTRIERTDLDLANAEHVINPPQEARSRKRRAPRSSSASSEEEMQQEAPVPAPARGGRGRGNRGRGGRGRGARGRGRGAARGRGRGQDQHDGQ
jgi:hypothetical protein